MSNFNINNEEMRKAVVDWDIEPADVYENLNEKTVIEQAKLLDWPVDTYINMTTNEKLDLIYDILHHNKQSGAKILDIPTEIILPKEVIEEALEENDYEVITEYLSDTYGWCITEYTLSDELEDEFAKADKEMGE